MEVQRSAKVVVDEPGSEQAVDSRGEVKGQSQKKTP